MIEDDFVEMDIEEKVLVVYNPTSGLAIHGYIWNYIHSYLDSQKINFESLYTSGESSLREVIKEKINHGFNRFLVAGGDGTVSLVADALLGTNFPLAIIPIGTGNLIARELQIPLAINKSLKLAISKKPTIRSIDGMKVNDQRIFLLNISAGISPELFQKTNMQEKRLLGRLIYVINFIKIIAHLKLSEMKFDYDGYNQTKYATELIISNSKILAFPPFLWQEASSLDDGKLGLHMVRALKISDVIKFALSLSLFPNSIQSEVNYFEIEKYIEVQSTIPLKIQADGDYIGVTPIRIDLVRNACNVIIPPK